MEINALLDQADKTAAYDTETRRLAAVFYENIGENFFTQQRYRPAVQMFETGAKLDPHNISCHFFLGLVYKSWGRFDDAISQYQTTLLLLDEKQRAGRQDSNDIFMYDRVYTELDKPTEAEKYRNLVMPEGNVMPPGMTRP